MGRAKFSCTNRSMTCTPQTRRRSRRNPMPGIKKRAGKTTFTIYAAEARQFRGVIDILNFVELNHDKDDMLCGNAGVLASGLAAILDKLEKPPKSSVEIVAEELKGKSK